MKVYIGCDEKYPYYAYMNKNWDGGDDVEVSEETVARWKKVFADFNAVQDELRDLYLGEL